MPKTVWPDKVVRYRLELKHPDGGIYLSESFRLRDDESWRGFRGTATGRLVKETTIREVVERPAALE